MIGKRVKARFAAIFGAILTLLVIWRLETNHQDQSAEVPQPTQLLSELIRVQAKETSETLALQCQSMLAQLQQGLLGLGRQLANAQLSANMDFVVDAANLTGQVSNECGKYWRSVSQVSSNVRPQNMGQLWQQKGDVPLNSYLLNAPPAAELPGGQTEVRFQPSVNRGLRYCLSPYHDEANQGEYQAVYRHLLESPGYSGTCSDSNFHDLLLVTIGWYGENQCGFEETRETTTDFKCLLILPTIEALSDFKHDDKLPEVYLQNTVVAAPTFYPGRYSRHVDILLAAVALSRVYEQPAATAAQIPRSFLLSSSLGRGQLVAALAPTETIVLDKLQSIASVNSDTRLILHDPQRVPLKCWRNEAIMDLVQSTPLSSPWFPCSDAMMLLQRSTFCLVLGSSLFAEVNNERAVDLAFQLQLLACLKAGSIPVLLGDATFPFPEAIGQTQWMRAVLQVSLGQIDVLVPYLRAIGKAKKDAMSYHGRLIYRRYFIDIGAQLSTVLLEVGNRYGLAQQPIVEYYTKPAQILSAQVTYHTLDPTTRNGYPTSTGPAKFPLDNIGAKMIQRALHGPEDAWKADPFHAYPTTPWNILDNLKTGSDVRSFAFLNAQSTREQFTVVILYYDRLDSVLKILTEFAKLSTLHSAVIVWNHPIGPNASIVWPQTLCQIKVLYGLKNSLNNRFLPLDLIQTDAVLSIDDDSQLTKDEVAFGFRVWRENREIMVGYPARGHERVSGGVKWKYVTGLNCSYSMILTGAAFFHKYYMYAYTWLMPNEAREMVDKRMNCEDIAMNFLISHTVRRPPLKATSRNTFVCQECPKKGLNFRMSHYQERSVCIEDLIKIYGYNPLIDTGYRADSVGRTIVGCG